LSVFANNPQRGGSLIELIMFIVIISVALAGIMLVMNQTTKGSADPLIRKQAIAAAYSLLEEVQLQDFTAASGVTTTQVTQTNRASDYHIINDYNNFQTTGIFTVAGTTATAGLSGYNASVSIVPAALDNIAAGSAVQINVTVTAPSGDAIMATGYRTAY